MPDLDVNIGGEEVREPDLDFNVGGEMAREPDLDFNIGGEEAPELAAVKRPRNPNTTSTFGGGKAPEPDLELNIGGELLGARSGSPRKAVGMARRELGLGFNLGGWQFWERKAA